MIKPALLYKDELLKLFSEEMYTDKYYFYAGYSYCHELPKIDDSDNCFQWVILSNDRVIGYMAYTIDAICDCVHNFGLYSFETSPVIGKELYKKMEELVSEHHRVEWRMISGNPVKKHYDKFCEKHNGNVVVLHDFCKDNYGDYHDEYIYEIVRRN